MNTETTTSELDLKIEKALEGIRPYLQADGGDVKFLKVDEEKVVHLELQGACETCPMSHMTMKAGIEEAIKREAPEINSIIAI